MQLDPQSKELQLNLGRIEFRVDRDNELEITVQDYDDHDICRWLKREEGLKLLDLLQRWLT